MPAGQRDAQQQGVIVEAVQAQEAGRAAFEVGRSGETAGGEDCGQMRTLVGG